MKSIQKILFVIVAVLLGTIGAQAQSFKYGVVAGMNLTKLHFSGSAKDVAGQAISSDNRAGWYFGPKVEFNTALGLGIDAALQYSQRKLNITTNATAVGEGDDAADEFATSESETYRTIEIPINLRYNIGLGSKLGVYVSTGPQFGFALGRMKWGNVGSGTNFSKENMNTTWNIGAGVRALGHLEVGIGYNFALGKVGKAVIGEKYVGAYDGNELKYKANTFQVQVAYLF